MKRNDKTLKLNGRKEDVRGEKGDRHTVQTIRGDGAREGMTLTQRSLSMYALLRGEPTRATNQVEGNRVSCEARHQKEERSLTSKLHASTLDLLDRLLEGRVRWDRC